jgi:serine/threonine-protein kinase
MNMSSNQKLATLGDVITGRWTNRRFRIVRALGSGGFGFVYLVEDLQDGRLKALKISRDMLTLVREFTILKKLNEAMTTFSIAPLAEILDDWDNGDVVSSFYVMEYIEGRTLRDILQSKKFYIREIWALIRSVGVVLHNLHRLGYAYCDLKPENIILDSTKVTYRLVDFGGVRDLGSAVIQFTPAYDRASHGCGIRKADPAYDVFALTGLMVTLFIGTDPLPGKSQMLELPLPVQRLWKQVQTGRIINVPVLLKVLDREEKAVTSNWSHENTQSCSIYKKMHKTDNVGYALHVMVYGIGIMSLIIFGITLRQVLQ